MKRAFSIRLAVAAFLWFCATPYAAADTINYIYNEGGRLVRAIYGDKMISFTYDKAGNLLQKEISPVNFPLLDISASGSDGPLSITSNDNVSIRIYVVDGGQSALNADWWVAAETPFGWFYYDVGNNSWLPGINVAYQGEVFTVDPVKILTVQGLPQGAYAFYFAIDTNMNGVLDVDDIHFDSVAVDVVP